ncbi:MAG: hypothetical protein IPJ01_12015 [Micavibrio sp.]|nr:hypothetical protein [Micavibrio sp.]
MQPRGKKQADRQAELAKTRDEVKKLSEALEMKNAPAKIAELKKQLAGVGNEAKNTRESMSGVGQAVGAVAGAFASAKIVGFFKGAIADANRFEQTMLKVASSARAVGESTSKAQQAAIDLAKDGFLTASQAGQTLSNLMQTGLSVDQAKKFVESSKSITAFGNTIGDASQAVQDLSLGLLRGSALVIDNASPALKSLANKYQTLVDTQGKAKAAQYAYNEIVKTGNRFLGDAERYMDTAQGAQARFAASTEKASAAIGTALQPALKNVYSALSAITEGFTNWFIGLGGGTKTILLVTSIIVGAVIPALGAVLKILPLIGIEAASAWAAMLGPLALIVAAIGAVALVVNKLHTEFANTKGQDMLTERNALKEIEKQQALSITQKRRLKELNEEIGKSYDPILKKLGLENLGLSEQLDIYRAIDKERDKAKSGGTAGAAMSKAALEETIAAQENIVNSMGTRDISGFTLSQQMEHTSKVAALAKDLQENKARLATYVDETGKKPPSDLLAGAKRTETRFLETRRKLEEIAANEAYTIRLAMSAKVSDAEKARRIANAKEDAREAAENEVSALRQTYAEFIEDKYAAEADALQKSTNDAKRASNEIAEAQIGLIEAQRAKDLIEHKNNVEWQQVINEKAEQAIFDLKKKNAERLADIEKAKIEKQKKMLADSLTDNLNAATAIAKGIQQIRSGDAAGGLASAMAGGGALGKGLETFGLIDKGGTASKLLGGLSIAGPVVGAFGALAGTLGDLFGKSDEERKKEAEKLQAIQAEQKFLLELQVSYSKSMLALQEAAAKLPFENLTRNLRLVDIEAQRQTLAGGNADTIETQRLADRMAEIQKVLTSESGAIGGGRLFAGQGSTADALTQFLNESAALRNQLGPIISLAQSGQNYKTYNYPGDGSVYLTGMFATFEAELARLGYGGTEDTRIKAAFYEQQTAATKSLIQSLINQGHYDPLGVTQAAINYAPLLTATDKLVAAASMQAQGGWYGNRDLDALLSEFNADVGIGENLLSVIEQSQQTQLDIAANTKKTAQNTSLQLESDRNAAFIDIAGGGVRQFGGFMSGVPLTLSEQANSLTLSSIAAKAVTKTDGELLTEILTVNKDMRKLLADIAINTEGISGTSDGLTKARLLQMLADFEAAA